MYEKIPYVDFPERYLIVKDNPLNFLTMFNQPRLKNENNQKGLSYMKHVKGEHNFETINSYLIKSFDEMGVVLHKDVIVYNIEIKSDVEFLNFKDVDFHSLKSPSNRQIIVKIDDSEDFKIFKRFFSTKNKDKYNFALLANIFGGYEIKSHEALKSLTLTYNANIFNLSLVQSIESVFPIVEEEESKIKFYDVTASRRVMLLNSNTFSEIPSVFEFRVHPKKYNFLSDMDVYEIVPKKESYLRLSQIDSLELSHINNILYIKDDFDLEVALKMVGRPDAFIKRNIYYTFEILEKCFSSHFGGVEIKDIVGIIWNKDLVESVNKILPTEQSILSKLMVAQNIYRNNNSLQRFSHEFEIDL